MCHMRDYLNTESIACQENLPATSTSRAVFGILLSAYMVAAQASSAAQPAAYVGDFGPNPQLPEPQSHLLPTIKIAKAVPWPGAQQPQPAAGLAVNAFAADLDHPRWLYVLPNGDVLVAETNSPAKPDDGKGIKGAVMKQAMSKAGAATPTANRITYCVMPMAMAAPKFAKYCCKDSTRRLAWR